nr:MAG TPA: hypothetical protein [Caudoviricetes sp.]
MLVQKLKVYISVEKSHLCNCVTICDTIIYYMGIEVD